VNTHLIHLSPQEHLVPPDILWHPSYQAYHVPLLSLEIPEVLCYPVDRTDF
jgi:hypothetical protein